MTIPPPRGYRNHNPGNIDRTKERWLGMSADQSGDARFAVFDSPEYGIRALLRTLITYYDRHGLKTVRGVINRWAPPVENNTGAYVGHVAAALGVGPDDEIDTHDRDTCLALARAIIRHELGNPADYGKPTHWYPPVVYDKAAALAGFKPAPKPLAKSRTLAGSATAGAATVASALYDAGTASVADAADKTAAASAFIPPGALKWLFIGLALAGIAAALYARLDDAERRLT